ncbi:sodium:solute symporter family transporter [Streptomyces bicolor]|uniref:sodium:solute symporter family transporter n=1 Tax=Streptomyces bicolor TaxID=66874 RepID=UPI000D13ED20|nr:hypothetical protein [Streptomyces bicolor]
MPQQTTARSATPSCDPPRRRRRSALDALGLELTRVLGSAGLPHVLMRIGTVVTAREARRSIRFSSLLIVCFSLEAVVIGLGAAGLLGTQAIASGSPSGKTAALLLADSLGGSLAHTAGSCLGFPHDHGGRDRPHPHRGGLTGPRHLRGGNSPWPEGRSC